MRRVMQIIFITSILVLLSACGSTTSSSQSTPDANQALGDVNFGATQNKIPTLVVIMNWTNYSENDPLVWYNKIFNKEENSVNRWYYDSTDAGVEFVPVKESSGIENDGIITVNMGKSHPGGYNDTSFRDTELRNAITSSSVTTSIDFASFDIDGDKSLSRTELQIIFVVSGGEQSYNDSISNSIWAHSWNFDSNNAPVLDGVSLMKADPSPTLSGTYMRFGATQGIDAYDEHKASIGIIAHELGHSLLDLVDLYDANGGGSGIGFYGMMSGGSWAKKTVDTYEGQTPVQFSAFSKKLSNIKLNTTEINTTITTQQIVTIKCSSNELVQLNTAKTNEYFLLECRDTGRVDSDRSFNSMDSSFTDNKLMAFIYHIDTDKTTNDESGTQNVNNHYRVLLLERDISYGLAFNEDLKANFSDAYTDGYTIDSTKTKTYNGTAGYNIVVDSSNYTDRTMTFKITK